MVNFQPLVPLKSEIPNPKSQIPRGGPSIKYYNTFFTWHKILFIIYLSINSFIFLFVCFKDFPKGQNMDSGWTGPSDVYYRKVIRKDNDAVALDADMIRLLIAIDENKNLYQIAE